MSSPQTSPEVNRSENKSSIHAGPGFILRRSKQDETALRCVVLTRSLGKVLMTAKGAAKPGHKLRPCLEPFAEADFHLFLPPARPYGRLIGAKLMNTHVGIRLSYPAFQTAAKCCESVDALIPFRHPVPDVYFLLKRVVTFLDHGGPVELYWLYFLSRFLEFLGHGQMEEEISRYVTPSEGRSIKAIFDGLDQGIESDNILELRPLKRALNVAEGRLNQVLPWRLKSSSIEE